MNHLDPEPFSSSAKLTFQSINLWQAVIIMHTHQHVDINKYQPHACVVELHVYKRYGLLYARADARCESNVVQYSVASLLCLAKPKVSKKYIRPPVLYCRLYHC